MPKPAQRIFQDRVPSVSANSKLRTPQREAFLELAKAATDESDDLREVGIILPVGCGKSGCITLTPFAFRSSRTLVVAPGLTIASQLADEFDPSNPSAFYSKCDVLEGEPFPEPVEIRGKASNRADLEESDVVITNIQQLQGDENRWLTNLPADFFDLIVFDEGHHNVADSWEVLKSAFPSARVVNFSATPLRADGRLMSGRVIYSFPVARAIAEGFVKRLKAVVLNPRTLRYVRSADGVEQEVSLDEVRRLGEEDADFRRSIVSSAESLKTIVDASIRELYRLRQETGEGRLKIIASALNYDHCSQIVEAYRSTGLRVDYVHSREDAAANKSVLAKLANHQLDVIVQVRKLGEGFDHKYLAVAAVFSVFSNLSPFVQFVGRIMRVIEEGNPSSKLNQGVVVFHAGANVARRWEDFQQYSQADQEYFDQLLPLEGLDFASANELEVEPGTGGPRPHEYVEVRAQEDVQLEEIPLVNDRTAMEAVRVLAQSGYSSEDLLKTLESERRRLKAVPTTKARERRSKQLRLDTRVKTEAARILKERGLNPEGRQLDSSRRGRTNLIVLKSAVDRQINALLQIGTGQRHELSRKQLEQVESEFSELIGKAVLEVFHE